MCFFGSEGHVALDRNPEQGYDTLLLRMIPGDISTLFTPKSFTFGLFASIKYLEKHLCAFFLPN